jgi:hypothetical protein
VQEVSDVTVAGTCANNYTRTKTWRAVDACGNLSATVAQTITVRDTQGPTIGSAGANGTIECTATPSFTAPTASDACGGATVRLLSDVTVAGTCANNYTRTRTWDAIDACGNTSATRTQTITVRDTQAPTIGGQGANGTIECTATPSFTAPTASDACGGATVQEVSDVTVAGSCANNYTRTKTWRAVDACGNLSATVAQTITVRDTQGPTIGSAGANGTIECTATPSFTAPTASDACGGATVRLLSDITVAGTCANNYTRTRTWDAIDACGNTSATRTQTITVRDTQAPTIGSAGANGTIECTATPSFTAPTASDACGGATVQEVSDVTVAGSCANNYTRTKTWRAVDACGNLSATVAQTITVRDTQAPTIGSAGANGTIECTATPSFTAPTASDACGGATVRLLSDVTAAGTCANNYTQTRTWDAIDACGNTSVTRTQTITVSDTQAPSIGGQGANATITCPASPSFTAPTASDACGGVTVNLVSDVTQATNQCGGYTETRTWNAVDACGNTSGTVSQTITVSCECQTSFCTYTQGYYGNGNGSGCDGNTTYPTTTAMLTVIMGVNPGPPNPVTIGRPGRSMTFPGTAAGRDKLIEIMPAGGTAKALNAGDCDATTACINASLKSGKINNVLAGQTIALTLNTRLNNGALLNVPVQVGWLTTQQQTGCGPNATPVSCSSNSNAIKSWQMNTAVANYLNGGNGYSPDVAGLLNLANDALGGVITPGSGGVPSFSDINNAVDIFNNAFDGCRMFSGYNPCNVTCAVLNPTCNISGSSSVNQGVTISYSSSANTAVSHSWSVTGNAVINGSTTGNSVSITVGLYAGGTSFTLRDDITATCLGNTNFCTKTVNINPPPGAPSITTLRITEATEITTQKLSVTAYPNPFTDKVRFVISSPVSGQASLEVYNMFGQKIQTIFTGHVFAGVDRMVEYNASATLKTELIYILKVGDKQTSGKVLKLD